MSKLYTLPDGVMLTRGGLLVCEYCLAQAKNTPSERGRFLKRHPKLCLERREFWRQLAQGTRSVDDQEIHEIKS